MVCTGRRPVENTVTLGGVATGSMKAHEALRAAGTMNRRGSVAAPTAAAAKMGMSSVVVAVLLVTSVRNVTARQIEAIMSHRGSVLKPSKVAPMVADKPD